MIWALLISRLEKGLECEECSEFKIVFDFLSLCATAGKNNPGTEDLIHKPIGWMLREIGKRDQPTEKAFLKTYCEEMPRTMRRYTIERFSEGLRRPYFRRERGIFLAGGVYVIVDAEMHYLRFMAVLYISLSLRGPTASTKTMTVFSLT